MINVPNDYKTANQPRNAFVESKIALAVLFNNKFAISVNKGMASLILKIVDLVKLITAKFVMIIQQFVNSANKVSF